MLSVSQTCDQDVCFQWEVVEKQLRGRASAVQGLGWGLWGLARPLG